MNLKRSYLVFVKTICLLVFINTSCSNQPAAHVKALEAAMNGHQVNGILSFFSDDVIFKMGAYKGEGILEFKKVAQWDSVLNATYSFYDLKAHEDTVFFKARLSTDLMKAMGFENGVSEVILKYTDELISYISFSMNAEDKKKDQQIWSSFMIWANEKKQDQLMALMPEGKFVIDGTTAKGWLELFREWNSAFD